MINDTFSPLLFNECDFPVFICDENFEILETNIFLKQKADSLFKVGIHLQDLSTLQSNKKIFEAAYNNAVLNLPYYSTNFDIMGQNTLILFSPFKNEERLSLLCLILNSNENITQEIMFDKYIYPIMKLMNKIETIAIELENIEQYTILNELNEVMQYCHSVLKYSDMINIYSQLINDKIIFQNENININKFLNSICTSMQLLLDNIDRKIILSCADENLIVNADIKYLSIAIFNIVSNACKYSSKGSSVYISLKKINNDVLISIKDEGIGIEQSKLQTVFEPFYSDSIGINAETDGYGLGLPMTKKIINKLKGTIFLSSEQNKGTSVAITLPISTDINTLTFKTNSVKYVASKHSDLYIYFSDICKINFF